MGRAPANLPAKRSHQQSNPSQALSDVDKKLYDLIRNKGNLGMWTVDVRREANIPDTIVRKSLTSLETKNLIKLVTNVQSKGRKYYMAAEFEPSTEITGGPWYTDGNFDSEFIKVMKEQCLNLIKRLKLASIDMLLDTIRKSGLLKIECSIKQIVEIVQALILDDLVEEMKSTGVGDFFPIPPGKVCYRALEKKEYIGGLSSVPCGACPRIYECTPDGIISPTNCVYFKKWLEF